MYTMALRFAPPFCITPTGMRKWVHILAFTSSIGAGLRRKATAAYMESKQPPGSHDKWARSAVKAFISHGPSTSGVGSSTTAFAVG